MKHTISPIRVIDANENGSGPASATVRTIVAVDEESRQCWDEHGVILNLDEVEQWARPQDDVWMTPISPVETSIVGADGEKFTDTLMPTMPKAKLKPAPAVPIHKVKVVADAEVKVDEQQQMRDNITKHEESSQQPAQHTVSDKDIADVFIDKLIASVVDSGKCKDAKQHKIAYRCKVDLQDACRLGNLIGLSTNEVIKRLIAKDAIDFSFYMQDDSLKD